MSSGDVIRVDEKACLKGGEMAGAYLDEIGKTDLAQLTEAEWTKFCITLVGFSFMFAMGPIPSEAPPF